MERLPLPDFRKVLDRCCGSGRHAAALAACGYFVTGVDRDPVFYQMDQRNVGELVGLLDGVLLLWQSFGYFSPKENDQVLDGICRLLRPRGRLLIDVFHQNLFRSDKGTGRTYLQVSPPIEDWLDGRLYSRIVYEDGTSELMDFEVFTPDELVMRTERAGLRLVEACSWIASAHPIRTKRDTS